MATAPGLSAILKFSLDISQVDIALEMPFAANIIHVGYQSGPVHKLEIWAECHNLDFDPGEGWKARHTHTRRFAVYGTGHQMTVSPMKHLGTVILQDAGLVWHVYERLPA